MPPVVTMTSHALASSSSSAKALPRSPLWNRRTSAAPCSAARAAIIGRLESGSWEAPGTSGQGTSSSPVEITATVGRAYTSTTCTPAEVSAASVPASTRVPAAATTAPAGCLPPAGRIWLRSTSTVCTVICSGSSNGPAGTSVCSTGTTRMSAPGGTGAPVMTRTAWPGGHSTRGAPAGISPATGNTQGPVPATSAACTAKPSIAELSKIGLARRARTSPASTCT